MVHATNVCENTKPGDASIAFLSFSEASGRISNYRFSAFCGLSKGNQFSISVNIQIKGSVRYRL